MRIELARQLGDVDAALAAGSSPREARLGLGEDELGFLWTVVAVSHDPRVVPHAMVLGDARRGASLALHALIAQLDGARARSLGPGRPLLADHVLVAGGDGPARVFVAPHRTAAFLAGDDAIAAAVAPIGERVVVPAAPVWSVAQRTAHARIAQALAEPSTTAS